MSVEEEGPGPQWTLLVCMPGCQAAHASIVRDLRDDGIDVVEHRFALTPEQALTIVQQYARLRRPAAAPPLSTSSTMEADAVETLSQEQTQRGPHPHLQQQAKPRAVSSQMLDDIMRLAQGHRAHQQLGASPTPVSGKGTGGAGEVAPRLSLSALPSLRGRGGDGDSANSEAMLCSQHSAHASASADTAGTTTAGTTAPVHSPHSRPRALSTLSAVALPNGCISGKGSPTLIKDPQVRQQVISLLHGGTVLVLLLRAVNAVERLVLLAGPQDPIEAQRVAPGSWSARYGVDEAQIGVYTPSNLADARVAVQAVFGEGYVQEQMATVVSRASPAMENSPVAPLSFAQILPMLRARVPAVHRMSYYT